MHLAHTGGSVVRHADLNIGLVQQRAQRPAIAATQGDHGHIPLMGGLHGLLRVAQALLREGADPDQRDLLNRSPREIALMRGYVDVAAELALPGNAPQAPVSMARFLRE